MYIYIYTIFRESKLLKFTSRKCCLMLSTGVLSFLMSKPGMPMNPTFYLWIFILPKLHGLNMSRWYQFSTHTQPMGSCWQCPPGAEELVSQTSGSWGWVFDLLNTAVVARKNRRSMGQTSDLNNNFYNQSI